MAYENVMAAAAGIIIPALGAVVIPSVAFGYCSEPYFNPNPPTHSDYLPSPPGSWAEPDPPFCWNEFATYPAADCSQWEIDSYINDIENFIDDLQQYLNEAQSFAAGAADFVIAAERYAQEAAYYADEAYMYARCRADEVMEPIR